MITGHNVIGFETSGTGPVTFQARNPTDGAALDPLFHEATIGEVSRACEKAEAAFEEYAAQPPARRAEFLRAIAEAIEALGDTLLGRTAAETALPRLRLESERARTVHQVRLFAGWIEEGSWVEARIDRAMPDRKPQPRPDLRRMLHPLGPVAVFGASNFPLAFSVAGGDTISALAAGCTVVVKAHPAHPGTCELVASAILEAARTTGMRDGVFSLVHGVTNDVGQALVMHPSIQAVGFTGSLRGGRALFDVAARRERPIPVYAEMGSSNPVFVLPGALQQRSEAIAAGLVASLTLGSGQFCTNPGLTIVQESSPAEGFLRKTGEIIAGSSAGTMVAEAIKRKYDADVEHARELSGVAMTARSQAEAAFEPTAARPALLVTDPTSFARHPSLAEEIYGPATLAVRCASKAELLDFARRLHGHLTATVHATSEDLAEYRELLPILRRKVGRVIVNGFPTGVEVCHAMQHGGPYPATTDSRSTSVGTAAIQRFARPVCYQDVPAAALPDELRDDNPRRIWRLVDGTLTKEPLA